MDDHERLRGAMNGSVKLWKLGERQQALKLLDDAISGTIREGGYIPSIRTMCHHAAILCRSSGELDLAKHYYEQSLAHSPENPMALYGLAALALEVGDLELAKSYATRSYRATVHGDDEIAKIGLLDLILKQWPDVGSN
jgi:Tfp pilus assembly protein PilF